MWKGKSKWKSVNYAFSSVIRRENFECYWEENENFLLNLTIGDEIIKASTNVNMNIKKSFTNLGIVTLEASCLKGWESQDVSIVSKFPDSLSFPFQTKPTNEKLFCSSFCCDNKFQKLVEKNKWACLLCKHPSDNSPRQSKVNRQGRTHRWPFLCPVWASDPFDVPSVSLVGWTAFIVTPLVDSMRPQI